MPGQNFASLGIDIASFSPEKEATLNRFIALFQKLDTYSAKQINPVFGPGLVDFNTAVSASSALLTEMNTKLASLTAALNGTSGGSQKAAAATKELTVASAALKVQIAEENREIIEYVKSKNTLLQARLAEKKAIADEKSAQKSLADLVLSTDKQIANSKKTRIAVEKELERAERQRIAVANESIRSQQQESRTTEKLISDYEQLKLAQKDQATNYANLFIAKGGKAGNAKDDPAVKAAFNELQATSTTINTIEKGLGKATAGAGAFGKTLTQGLSGLRTLAYILPGIGIAGIFNLAYEAIGKAVEEMGLFTNETERYLDYQNALNKSIQDQIALTEKLFSLDLKLSEERNGRTTPKDKIDLDEISLDKTKVIAEKYRLAEIELNKSTANIIVRGNSPESLKSDLENRLRVMDSYAKKVFELQKKIDTEGQTPAKSKGLNPDGTPRDVQGTRIGIPSIDILKKQKEQLEGKLKIDEEKYKVDKGLLDKYTTDQQDFFKTQRENEILFASEERRRIIETAKQNISVNQDKNNIILKDDIRTEQEKTNALKALRNDQLRLSNLDLYNTTGNKALGIPANSLATPGEIAIAKNKAKDDELKINADFNRRQKEQDEQYRQIRLKAQSEIDQAEVNTSAIRDEKITNNEENSLKDRLEALVRYINRKQELQDIQLETELNQEKYKTGDQTAAKLIEEQQSKAAEQKSNIQADVEKKVYDIIYQSTQKQLKLVIDENKIDIEKNREKYGEEVRDLTESFRNKKISYTKYRKELKEIDFKFQGESLDKTIIQDKIAVDRIKDILRTNVAKLGDSETEVSSTQQRLINAKESNPEDLLPAQEAYDTAIGKQKGYLKAIQDGQVAFSNAEDKLKADQFTKNNLRLQEDIRDRKEYYQAIRQVEEAIYKTIKELGDKEYEYKLRQLELKKQTIDEQYGFEIAAIEKSSLTAKDKAALDIQLNAQKHQYDVETAKEEKKIKHDQAVFDRDIAIAHILLSTAEAVAALIEIPPLAIAAGIAGAAELVIATNVRIPSYKKGTDNHPGGFARYGEDGTEIVIKPYQSPYLVNKETIGVLPRGTRVIPIKDHPEYGGSTVTDDSWKQTMFLAKQIKKYNSTTVVNNINIDLGFQSYKRRILGQ